MKPVAHHEAGLHLFTSNRLETLAAKLASRLRTPLSSPLQPEIVVVRNKGMERWLKLELAARHGICANTGFPFPEAFGQRLFRELDPELPAESPLERDALVWRIVRALPAMIGRPGFLPIQNYLHGTVDQRKLVQLAGKIANLFDQYLIFRPAMILEWDRGQEDHWQAILWREVAAGFSTQHAAALWRRAASIASGSDPEISNHTFERLSIFGVSALPPFYLDLFAGLARERQVNLFLLQPSREYWGDITSPRESEKILRRQPATDADPFQLHLESGNRLLASMGYLGRDFLKLLLDAGDWITDEDFSDPGQDTLLHRLQSDILHLIERRDDDPHPRPVIAFSDDSIRVHSCHSPMREMEVLQDQMLDWFQRDPALTPRDIVVMTPDIETYAPFIHAVFGSPEYEARTIPFNVADQGERRQSHVIDTFLQLLALPDTRLGAATVLAFLETAAVRDRFGIIELDLDLIRSWIDETNIRWGIDAAHRARLKLPALDDNTWRAGLDRMLLGYAMSGRGERVFHDILPCDDIEGRAAAVLGRFVEFIERIIAAVGLLQQKRSLDDWAETLGSLLRDFFQPSEDAALELQTIRDQLTRLRRHQALSGFDQPIELAAVLERLVPALEQDIHNSGFLTGGVTFCGLKPMRSIPFKIVCLVGMNDGAFPRPTQHLSFDLMAAKPRLGDRSTREDDRYLFLETLLSARDRLHLSYVGQSIRDNSEAPPSVLLSELMDCIVQGFELEQTEDGGGVLSRILVHHRLQAFSEEYFKPQGRLFSYSQENCRASAAVRSARATPMAFIQKSLPEPEAEFRELTLDDLASFLGNPARFFLTRRLRLQLPEEAEELSEREPFTLDALANHHLKQELLGRRLAEQNPEDVRSLALAGGRLPLGAVGQADYQRSAARVEQFHQRLAPLLSTQPAPPIDIDLNLEPFHLSGRTTGQGRDGLLFHRCAKIKSRDILRAWIQHLAVNASGLPRSTTLIGEDASCEYSAPVDSAALLRQLLDLYWQGLSQPLKFFPGSALAFAEADLKRQQKQARAAQSAVSKKPAKPAATASPLDKARAEWEGSDFPKRDGERDDVSFDLCFRNLDPLDTEFAQLALTVFNPILAHQNRKDWP